MGVSMGVERLFAIKLAEAAEAAEKGITEAETEVLVCSASKGMLPERLRLCAELWKADIKVGGRGRGRGFGAGIGV